MTTGKKIFTKIGATAIAAAALTAAIPATGAFAAEENKIDLSQNGSIRVELKDNIGGEEVCQQGVGFDLYYVGDIDEYGNITFTGDLANASINGNANSDGVANAINSYVTTHNVTPLMSGSTDTRGLYTFSGLKPGAYMLIGQSYDYETATQKYSFSIMPSYFTIPSDLELISDETVKDEKANIANKDVRLHYNVTVYPKRERTNAGLTTNLAVTKAWDDNENEAKLRPDSITVKLWRKNSATGEVTPIDTQTLSDDNNWRYKWQAIQVVENCDYYVTEEDIPGSYSVSESKESDTDTNTTTFVLRNTYTPPTTTTENIKTTTEGGGTIYTKRTTRTLPYTGMLWWPVPFLAAGGAAFILIGVAGKRREKAEK